MVEDRAICVPRHGLPATVHAVRFMSCSEDSLSGSGRPIDQDSSDLSTTLEVWPGNFYGDLDGEMVARQSAAYSAEFVFSEAEAPRIEPERSLVVLLHNPPERWQIEFEVAVVSTSSKRTESFRVIIDNYGTARDAVDPLSDTPGNVRQATSTHTT